MNTLAQVNLWGRTIGAVSWDDKRGYAAFEYQRDFIRSRVQLSPIVMPLSDQIYSFPELPKSAFYGLPGLLADTLPDKFGNALINVWLSTQGRSPDSFNPVERLCYTGSRGMGALEFKPVVGPETNVSQSLVVEQLVQLASKILTERDQLDVAFVNEQLPSALQTIFRIGTSAGGARAKAVIAWNKTTNEVRSGQVNIDQDFEYWLIKFDGVTNNRDKELNDPQGFGAIEYAYYLMATAAGITMSECHVLNENNRQHFMTKRFDRVATENGVEKLHMQTLGALCHYDFNQAGAYSYEQALSAIRQLHLPMAAIEQQFRRMVFNVVARNQDDHVKNIAFLMNKQGQWSLSPAYDVMYSYNPDGLWTGQHQMSINGKRDHFTLGDFTACAKTVSMQRGRAQQILQEVIDVVAEWPSFAEKAGVSAAMIEKIQQVHRLIIKD
jgi:serine/threonine-protein kinase HipA